MSLDAYGLWATITGLIAVLAAVDTGLATVTTRKVAAARGGGLGGAEGVPNPTSHRARRRPRAMRWSGSVARASRSRCAPGLGRDAARGARGLADHARHRRPDLRTTGLLIWLGVVLYQTVGWYYAMLAAVSTGLQRGDLANAANAVGAVVGAVVTVLAVVAGMGIYGLLVGMWALGVVTMVLHLRNAVRLTGDRRVGLPQRAPRRPDDADLRPGAGLPQASLLVEPAVAKFVLSAFDGSEAAAAMQLGFTVSRMALVAAMAPTAAILVGVAGGARRSPAVSPGWCATPATRRWRWWRCWQR